MPDRLREVTGITALPAPFDPNGVTVTVDALHASCRDHATRLVQMKKAHYPFSAPHQGHHLHRRRLTVRTRTRKSCVHATKPIGMPPAVCATGEH
ncbi:hypothetical protein GCM10010358_74220 [Streptomyces minutiscleroticus]|uniref:Uncharacterized protein n=1 Tax=Streptomyces minutiscleroticus TaxID=68238 RepID=A0A918P1X6_9ACTN|nr:hypothetical protein GCM10010358_74220 [Streptomyces minutiscleroticus]